MDKKELINSLHQKALCAARSFHNAQKDLLDLLLQLDRLKGFIHLGYTSLYTYALEALKLSDFQAVTLIQIARKSQEVPELKKEVEQGKVSLSNAHKILPVLTKENAPEWLKKASSLSKRDLEREVVRVKPQARVWEKYHWTAYDRIALQLGLSEEGMKRLIRIQDLLSSKRKKSVSWEEVIDQISLEYLDRHDPVEKAKRYEKRKEKISSQSINPDPTQEAGDTLSSPETQKEATNETAPEESPRGSVGDEIKVWADVLYGNANLPWPGKVEDSEREPIPVWVKHEIIGRDGAQCRYVFANGKRCTQRRWLHVHHLQEVRNGGSNTVKNLITLCANHHRMVHLKQAHGETFQKPVQKNLELL